MHSLRAAMPQARHTTLKTKENSKSHVLIGQTRVTALKGKLEGRLPDA
jgi:hypothetical protein